MEARLFQAPLDTEVHVDLSAFCLDPAALPPVRARDLLRLAGGGSLLVAGLTAPDLLVPLWDAGVDAFGLLLKAPAVARHEAATHADRRERNGAARDVREPSGAFAAFAAGATRRVRRSCCAEASHLPFGEHRFSAVCLLAGAVTWSSACWPDTVAALAALSTRYIALQLPPALPHADRADVNRARLSLLRRIARTGLLLHPLTQVLRPFEEIGRPDLADIVVFERAHRARVGADPSDPCDPECDGLMLPDNWTQADVASHGVIAKLIRPNDTVIDLGARDGARGSHLWDMSEASSVTVLLDAQAIESARGEYAPGRPGLRFAARSEAGLPWGDHHADMIVRTIHAPDDDDAIGAAEIARVLIPGGRCVLEIRASGVGGAARVERLVSAFSRELLFERAIAVCDPLAAGLARGSRHIEEWIPGTPLPDATAIVIVMLMKDPLCGASVPYRETVLPEVNHPPVGFARDYLNPWLAHSMVHVSFRAQNPDVLASLASRVIQQSPPDSADRGAALCVLAYQALRSDREPVPDLRREIERYLAPPPSRPHVHRWQVSLRFAAAHLDLRRGRLTDAVDALRDCGRQDALAFSPHLATKPTEALFMAGYIEYLRGRHAAAREIWREGVGWLDRLLTVSAADVLVDPERPNAFDVGDGPRELILALEFVALCANGLHALAAGRPPRADPTRLLTCFHQSRAELLERGDELVAARALLATRMCELDDTRDVLRTRTRELDDARETLRERTNDLDHERATLRERTKALDHARAALRERTAELIRERDARIEERLARAHAYADEQTAPRLDMATPLEWLQCRQLLSQIPPSATTRIVVFGAARLGRAVIDACHQCGWPPMALVDNATAAQGGEYRGIVCRSPCEIIACCPTAVVITSISSGAQIADEIAAQFSAAGLPCPVLCRVEV